MYAFFHITLVWVRVSPAALWCLANSYPGRFSESWFPSPCADRIDELEGRGKESSVRVHLFLSSCRLQFLAQDPMHRECPDLISTRRLSFSTTMIPPYVWLGLSSLTIPAHRTSEQLVDNGFDICMLFLYVGLRRWSPIAQDIRPQNGLMIPMDVHSHALVTARKSQGKLLSTSDASGFVGVQSPGPPCFAVADSIGWINGKLGSLELPSRRTSPSFATAGAVTNKIWWKSWDKGWSDWVSLVGESMKSSPVIISTANKLLDVFALGEDNALWTRSYRSTG
ncbi:hypothetical protein K505DRAFT_343507 [Melanomma pulvis-pyrius CBS 109.77]|uniref:PLL-like beta propeller domain-containing protein n=1 Tax=Melanomma pulvis-pyrius CBS 109.77 TaxID=1314802 RepID=A0A6A6WSK8_9PLEO|nr:hypothetical protein K505DRAFT_343507 [Melanomma pulvis-pyrius CBS 109.77]